MKKALIILLFTVASLGVNAQINFECDLLKKDVEKWNSLIIKDNNVKWAKSIMANNMYKVNADGSLEYVYIINASDTIDMKQAREITFDYLCYYFNIDNESRAAMVTNSEGDGVFFQGKYNEIGAFVGVDRNIINANIVFNIKFKPNRIRFSIKIIDYQVLKYDGVYGMLVENRQVYVKDAYPMNQKSSHKKSFSMAFINANVNCMNYTEKYIDYLTKHLSSPSQSVEEDW